jgi:predicted nucleotidyltransferase component of viral defense system
MKKEDFKQYVEMALKNTDLATMRPVVEKELMHYEIFNALDEEGLLKNLVFQGGTSLRLCRGSDRFSEDLDFAGGKDFSSASMEKIKDCIVKRIGARFGLKVTVTEPKPAKEGALVNVAKWMVSIETSPGEPDVPRQKIKVEIANIPAYTREAVPLRMNYSVLEGMNRVIVVTKTIDEILADKIVALPTSIAKLERESLIPTPTKIRHRDIWDLAWLVEQGARLDPRMVKAKIDDYGIQNYTQLLKHAIQAVPGIASGAAFKAQMQRFIRKSSHDNAFGKPGFDAYLANTVNRLFNETKSTV